MSRLHLLLIFIATWAFQLNAFSQNVVMNVVEIADNQIVVHYDLNDLETHHVYSVSLYSSQDGYTNKLTKVIGDVGYEVPVGKDKKIIWDISNEYGPYKGRLTFEVRAHLYVPFVKIMYLDEGKVFKRGKTYPVEWIPGNPAGSVNIDVYKGDQKIFGVVNKKNTGLYRLAIPVSTAIGRNYKLKFTNAGDPNEVKYSLPFVIKRKVPTAVKLLAVAVVGAGTIILTGGTPAPIVPPPADRLPDAPGPP